MLKDLELPEGRIMKVVKGGPDALKKIMPLLGRKKFNGYLRLVSTDSPNAGYVILKDGKRVEALFAAADGFLKGKEALPRFRELAKDQGSMIEVHTDVEVDSLLSSLKRGRGRALRGLGSFKKKLDEWRSQGKDVEPLEAAMGQGLSKAIRAFKEYKAKIGQEQASPEPMPESAQEQNGHPAKERSEGTGPSKKEAPIPKEAAKEIANEARPPAAGGESGSPHRVRPGLLDRYSFENFIVGASNRFAHAACMALANGSVDPYNPLFVTGGPGLGKTHLLHALGNRLLQRRPEIRLTYLTAGQFRTEVEEAESGARLSKLRQAFRELEVLILDDIRDLEGKARVQEELLGIFEELHEKGRLLVFASVCSPSEMNGLDARLVSRLESGLVADLQPPNLDLRLAYLSRQLEERGASCPPKVLRYLAEKFTYDMRELDGALNRILAYSSTLGVPLDLSMAREALGRAHRSQQDARAPKLSFDLLPGRSYLVKEERADVAYRLFAQRVRSVKGLLITRVNPSRVRENYGMTGAEILWLTDRGESSESTVEPVLERLMHKVERFMITGGQGLFMLDGVEYLMSSNSFEAVMKFVRRLVDDISESEFTFILALNPMTLGERELSLMEIEMEILEP